LVLASWKGGGNSSGEAALAACVRPPFPFPNSTFTSLPLALDVLKGEASDAGVSECCSVWQQIKLVALLATAADFRFFGMGRAFRDYAKSQYSAVKTYSLVIHNFLNPNPNRNRNRHSDRTDLLDRPDFSDRLRLGKDLRPAHRHRFLGTATFEI